MKRIVVGTDGSEYATAAVRWAADEAAIHGATLAVVLAWNYLDQHHPDRSHAFEPGYTENDARSALAAWVADDLGAGGAVEQHVMCDLPVRALLEAGDVADLLVLGARGTGRFE
jgi:nucleotide-binding universal stress UspA family protein